MGAGDGRRLVVAAVAAAMLAVPVLPAAASADPSRPEPVCEVRDTRLIEISGMAATDAGFVMVNDGADDESRRRVFFLGGDCRVVRTVPYPSPPRDTEDLAVGPDGTVWVADVGDNDRDRQTVAVWKLPPGARRPVLYRMAYPDRPHDAEALLVTGDGRPLIVTKYSAELYAPSAALRAGATVPLARVGQVRLPSTTTSNPYSFLGRSTITGAATSPDGRRVVLRTYADAFEFDVPDGDVVSALTAGRPRVTPLPDEPQGESITYSRDGRSLLTVSETADQPAGTRPRVLRYALADAPATPTASTATGRAEPATPATGGAAGEAGARRALSPLPAAGLALVVVVAGGVAVAVRRSRRR